MADQRIDAAAPAVTRRANPDGTEIIPAAVTGRRGKFSLLLSAARDYIFPAADRAKLAGIEAGSTADQTGAEIVALLTALAGADRLSATALRDLPAAAADGDLTGIALDGRVLTVTRRNGADIVINLPAGEGGGGAALTGPQIVALLEALAGDARLDATAIDGFDAAVESATDGDLTGIAIAGRVLTVTRRGQANIALNLPAAGETTAQTGAEIVALLSALAGAARLPYAALRDTPDIPDATDGTTVRDIINDTGAAALADDDLMIFRDASTSELARARAADIKTYMQEGLSTDDGGNTDPPADTWAQQFAIIAQADGASARDIAAGSAARHELIVPFDAAPVTDEAGVGITRATGRTAFANLHADADTPLRATGSIRVFVRDLPAGQMRLTHREYDAGNNLLSTVVVADHGVAAAAGKRTFDLPVTNTALTARRGRTYDLFVEFTPASAVGAGGGSFGVDVGATATNLLAYQRWLRDAQADLAPLTARVDALEADDGGGGGGSGLRGLPESVPAPLRGKSTYIRVTSPAEGASAGVPTSSFAATDTIPGVTRFVAELATPPAALHERARLTTLWRGRPPGDYEGAANPVERNAVSGTLGTRNITYQSRQVEQHGWDTVAPGLFGGVTVGADFTPEFYWWRPQGPGTPWVLNAWIPNAYADTRASIYIEATSSESATTIGQGLNRTAGRLGATHRQYQSSAPLSADEVTALAAIHDAAGDNDLTLRYFESPDGSAKGAALNFQPAFVWEAVLGQHHIRPFITPADPDDRLLRGADIMADWGVEPVFASMDAALTAGALNKPGLVFATLDEANKSQRPQRFFVRRGYAGTDGAAGAVSGRNRLRVRLNAFANGLGYYWAMPYRAGHIIAFDNVRDPARIAPGDPFGVITIAGSQGGQNPLVQIGVRDPGGANAVAWPADAFFIVLSNREGADGRDASEFTLRLARNAGADATATYGGVVYNLYSYRFSDELTADLGSHGQWIFRAEVAQFDFTRQNGADPINFNPDEQQFTRGAGYRAPTDAVPADALPLPGGRQFVTRPIVIAPFHPSESQAAAADLTAWTHVVTAAEAGDDAEITAKFTTTTSGANASNRLEIDFRLELRPADRGATRVLDRAAHYVRHSSGTEFTLASFSMSGHADLAVGDTLALVSRSFDQFADSDLMIATDATVGRSVNALSIVRR